MLSEDTMRENDHSGNEARQKLCELPVGARVIIRCKHDWRSAAISRLGEERVVLTIASPTGRNYRKSCPAETFVDLAGTLPVIGEGPWRESFVRYDYRW
ncbi:MAG: hypothetical protein IPJ30_05885 [Acidobacteria bacterium]|nr:hypothetical protein [Acidobacteriota bacterium]